jgi:hypothetical protein
MRFASGASHENRQCIKPHVKLDRTPIASPDTLKSAIATIATTTQVERFAVTGDRDKIED